MGRTRVMAPERESMPLLGTTFLYNTGGGGNKKELKLGNLRACTKPCKEPTIFLFC